MKVYLFFLSILLTPALFGQQLTREGSKKLDKLISDLYPQQTINLKKLDLQASHITDTEILNADGHWFAIAENDITRGWLSVNKIWGRYHEFEYAMIIDSSFKIKNITILSYPATHGNAVTNKKWLVKFNGYSASNTPEYGREIDALAGATISGTSLSHSVKKSLLIFGKLQKSGLLK
ncbi:MAG: FMN-binding protein [Lentimicrobiaceae bacterium]|nr:FMN-binding protein [Lentimicrobiaceae bacterium]MCO5265045.1 FMN-binding protein [Lentimicrobium sp.]HPG34143.1 FMN-binding protein [Lentimicrobium sp.]